MKTLEQPEENPQPVVETSEKAVAYEELHELYEVTLNSWGEVKEILSQFPEEKTESELKSELSGEDYKKYLNWKHLNNSYEKQNQASIEQNNYALEISSVETTIDSSKNLTYLKIRELMNSHENVSGAYLEFKSVEVLDNKNLEQLESSLYETFGNLHNLIDNQNLLVKATRERILRTSGEIISNEEKESLLRDVDGYSFGIEFLDKIDEEYNSKSEKINQIKNPEENIEDTSFDESKNESKDSIEENTENTENKSESTSTSTVEEKIAELKNKSKEKEEKLERADKEIKKLTEKTILINSEVDMLEEDFKKERRNYDLLKSLNKATRFVPWLSGYVKDKIFETKEVVDNYNLIRSDLVKELFVVQNVIDKLSDNKEDIDIIQKNRSRLRQRKPIRVAGVALKNNIRKTKRVVRDFKNKTVEKIQNQLEN